MANLVTWLKITHRRKDPSPWEKGIARWDALVNPNCSTENIIEGRLERPIFLHLWLKFIPSDSMLFTLSFILIPQQMGRNRKNTCLYPNNTVWFTRAPGHRVTVLDISFSFQAPLHTAVSLRFPEYRFFLFFSWPAVPSWGNLGQPLSLLPYNFLTYKWKWKFLLLSFTNGCEDHLRKLIWKSCETITQVSVI